MYALVEVKSPSVSLSPVAAREILMFLKKLLRKDDFDRYIWHSNSDEPIGTWLARYQDEDARWISFVPGTPGYVWQDNPDADPMFNDPMEEHGNPGVGFPYIDEDGSNDEKDDWAPVDNIERMPDLLNDDDPNLDIIDQEYKFPCDIVTAVVAARAPPLSMQARDRFC